MYTNTPTKKKNRKKSPVDLNGSSSLKIIFTLLIKLVAVHVQFSIVHIWHHSFKELLAFRWRPFGSLFRLQVGLPKQFIQKNQSGSRNGNQNKN